MGWFIWCITQDSVSLQHSEPHAPPELSILNNCSPSQVSPSIPAAAAAGGLLLSLMSHSLCHPQLEGLCSFLQLSTCPEPFLVRFCSWLLALTPDLSYSSAATLAGQLFLRRVRARTEELSCSPFPSPLSLPPAFSVPRCCPSPSRLPDTSWLPSPRFAPSIPIPCAVCWWLQCCRSQGKVWWAGGRCGCFWELERDPSCRVLSPGRDLRCWEPRRSGAVFFWAGELMDVGMGDGFTAA